MIYVQLHLLVSQVVPTLLTPELSQTKAEGKHIKNMIANTLIIVYQTHGSAGC